MKRLYKFYEVIGGHLIASKELGNTLYEESEINKYMRDMLLLYPHKVFTYLPHFERFFNDNLETTQP